ncbi:MAG: hypothetical protein IT385_25510 [Deltaproteobacteria bacterium]|nr:hypothetical protein [Deltaproteobacteria bacterium]
MTSIDIIRPRARELYHGALAEAFRKGDQLFLGLALLQWCLALAVAVVVRPPVGTGDPQSTYITVAALGGALIVLPIALLVRFLPGRAHTRHAIAVGQMLWSTMFIHLTHGRMETHFHVFASLAFLAFYRDWKVLVTATSVVVIDHLARAVGLAESSYAADPGWWHFVELGLWVGLEDVALFMGIHQTRRGMWALAQRQAEVEDSRARIEVKVEDRTRELKKSREQYRALLETTRSIPWELDRHDQRFRYVGPQLPELIGLGMEGCLAHGFLASRLHPSDRDLVLVSLGPDGPSEVDAHLRMRRADGGHAWLRLIGSASEDGIMRGTMFDVTQTHELELQLRQAQKLESVGRLASGVAHEINTPVQFVNDSVHFVRDAMRDLGTFVARSEAVARSLADGSARPEAGAELLDARDELDVPYLLDAVPSALDRAADGLGRIADIVRSMKEFAHPDQKELRPVDINHALATTLTIARNEYKYVADVTTELGELPPVPCRGGEMNQVFLNLVVNAAHAIAERVAEGERGRITITTRVDGTFVEIAIGDTGTGIPEAIRDRIFDPFFTTKEVGKGTGQGLSISRSVVEKHGGELRFETELGRGTTFFVRLPIEGRTLARDTQGWVRPVILTRAAA